MTGIVLPASRSRLPLNLRIGGAIVLAHLILAAIGMVWTPYGPNEMGTGRPFSPISFAHPFGVDQLGRDVFSRVLSGAHLVILLSISGTSLGLVVGGSIGLLSGYLRGIFDEITQRIVETLISIPFLVLALIAIAAAGPALAGNPVLIIFVVAFVYAPRIARIARAAALDIAGRDFIVAARLRGESTLSIVRSEILPNATGVLLIEFALRAGYAPVLIGSLGFLGFGLRPPTPEWGLMISESRAMVMVAPAIVLGPAFALASLVIGLNLFTDGLARVLDRTMQVS
jgi:peptide/nickel transport system permease protein